MGRGRVTGRAGGSDRAGVCGGIEPSGSVDTEGAVCGAEVPDRAGL